MRKIVLFVISLLLICVCRPTLGQVHNDTHVGLNAFTFSLFRLVSQPDMNLVISPYSVASPLSILALGARGNTRAELFKTLSLPDESNEKLVQQFNAINQSLLPSHSCGNYFCTILQKLDEKVGFKSQPLMIANAIWTAQGLPVTPSFQETLNSIVGLEWNTVNFKKTARAVVTINDWVAKKTHGKISHLLFPTDIPPLTSLVVTNALYFKGLWEHPFKKKDTTSSTFTLLDNTRITVPMMWQHEHFGYAENNILQLLQLSYKKTDLAMIIFLPKKNHTLEEVQKYLSPITFSQLLTQLTEQEIAIAIPKFSILSRHPLNTDLMKMGMVDVFSKRADFSDISPWPVFVGGILQEAGIEVDEAGTVAFAATATVIFAGAMLTKTFEADHPFIFIIYDKKTTTILFIGKVVNPLL